MTTLFIGGPLDGELREVPEGETLFVDRLKRSPLYVELPRLADCTRYHISNGIARHESVGEEEVARRVYGWRERWIDATDGETP